MAEDIYWTRFTESGSVACYLEYLAHKENKNDTGIWDRSDGTGSGRE